MNLSTKFWIGLVLIFLCIQVMQPTPNSSEELLSTDVTNVVVVPQKVQDILKTACYDCHSNNTRYPWYSWIQPGASFMNNHIKKGKTSLNFSDFGSYSRRKQEHKFQSIIEQVKTSAMPIATYATIHREARLSEAEKEVIMNWAYSQTNKEY